MSNGECIICGAANDPRLAVCPVCGESTTGEPLSPTIPDGLEFDYELDRIGPWSTVKHEIVEKYASAYMTIMAKHPQIRSTRYIDAFAGTAYSEDRDSGDILYGSAARAIEIVPPFTHIDLIEKDPTRAASLRRHVGHDDRVHIYGGDAIKVLETAVLPKCRYDAFARGLCLLDPYGLSVPWSLIEKIGKMRSVEIFFNFMVVGANRNVLWKDRARVSEKRKQLMDFTWGDRKAWEDACYQPVQDLFGGSSVKASNEAIVAAFRERLEAVAGFPFVPPPIPITNTKGATIYYLFFASHNSTAGRIVTDIFDRYR